MENVSLEPDTASMISSTDLPNRFMISSRPEIQRLLIIWDARHPRFNAMLDFCRQHNEPEEYSNLFSKANDEELANMALTLCRQVDKMTTYLAQLEKTFVEEGGIKERMTAARLGRRKTQNEIIEAQAHEIEQLRKRINELEEELRKYRGR
jgi:four helix bundle suffix protein